MPSKLPQFTVRIEPELLKKFKIIAEFNTRSANREAEFLIRNHVAEFEKQHGKIKLD